MFCYNAEIAKTSLTPTASRQCTLYYSLVQTGALFLSGSFMIFQTRRCTQNSSNMETRSGQAMSLKLHCDAPVLFFGWHRITLLFQALSTAKYEIESYFRALVMLL
jgi:hypothetical protein